jgi:hypothetical protein
MNEQAEQHVLMTIRAQIFSFGGPISYKTIPHKPLLED